MKNTRTPLKLISALLISLSLAACGGGGDSGAGSAGMAKTEASGSAAPVTAARVVASPYPSYNTSPLPADMTGMTRNAVQLSTLMKAGWNAGNTLEATGGETAWGNPMITPQLIALVKQSGFTAVRLPAAWDQYANQSTGKISDVWLNRIKAVVQMCADNGLYVVVNIHWDGGWLEENLTKAKQASVSAKQKAYWEQIATHLRDFDEHLLFASANEPHADDATQMAVLLAHHQTFIDTVRATGGKNAYRTLIVQGPRTDIEKTNQLMTTMPKDRVAGRLMTEVHFYPYQFTLMTADETWGNQFFYWGNGFHSTTDTAHNATWGEEAWVDSMFALMKTQFVDKGIPVIIGEFGAIRRESLTGDALNLHLASRAHYLNYVSKRAVANGMVPFYWDAGYTGNNSWAIFNRQTNTVHDQQALNALISGGNGL